MNFAINLNHLFHVTMKFLKLALMLAVLVLVVSMIAGYVSAQEATAVPQLPEDGGAIAGFLPAWLLPWIVIVNAVLTLFSRISDVTATDVDNKAIGWVSKIVNILGGHVLMVNGNPNKPSANLLKS